MNDIIKKIQLTNESLKQNNKILEKIVEDFFFINLEFEINRNILLRNLFEEND